MITFAGLTGLTFILCISPQGSGYVPTKADNYKLTEIICDVFPLANFYYIMNDKGLIAFRDV